MATLLKIIPSVDYLDMSDDGIIDFEKSRKKLTEIARSNATPVDYEILLDFRRTQWSGKGFASNYIPELK